MIHPERSVAGLRSHGGNIPRARLARRRAGSRLLFVVIGLLLAGPAAAQSATLVVRVVGDSLPLAGAVVQLTLLDEVLVERQTSAAGEVRFTGLPATEFEVVVMALGFRQESRSVRVVAGETTTVEVELRREAFDLEGLTVLSDRVRIEFEDTEFSSRFDEVAIQMLPLARQARDLIALTPGARPGHVWGGANFQANSFRLDGLSANHPGVGGDALEPSIHWIEEVSVRGLGAGAEHGGFQGGLIDIVTKRGTDDFQGMLRTNFEDGALNASNLVDTEIGREVVHRQDVEGEVRGPLIPGRLHYYLSGIFTRQRSNALNHLNGIDSHFTPFTEDRTEGKVFAKLNFAPAPGHDVVVSGAYNRVAADHHEPTGYEAPDALHRYTAPTWFLNGSWTGVLGSHAFLEARFNHFESDERHDPVHGRDVPGMETNALTPPFAVHGNAPLTLRSHPTSTSGTVQATLRLPSGEREHEIKIGGELVRGSYFNQRTRNGNLTWMPFPWPDFDPGVTDSWSRLSWVPSRWGGEVHLDADVHKSSAYVQSALALGPRITVTPGLRWSRWDGYLTNRDGVRFRAVSDQGLDPRIGLSIDVTGEGNLVVKGHWGRYHQDMITQMFDRAAGADVFTDEEVWSYWGDLSDPTTSFTVEERDALAEERIFRRESVIALNESGPVVNYRQPYVDQWLVAVERSLGWGAKISALYTQRRNHDMVALVDRNRDLNYTTFHQVRVMDAGGTFLPYGGGTVMLPEFHIPNYVLLERLRCKASGLCPEALGVPGLQPGDSIRLGWDPDYILTTAPGARREFSQLQVALELAQPTWGASISYSFTDLKGNLDNVSGYTDPHTYGPGPYVRVNEGVNAFGHLENFARHEGKASAWGTIGRTRVGAYWTFRSGDHYAPQFRVSGLGFYRFRLNTGAMVMGPSGVTTTSPGEELDYKFVYPLEGHDIFVGPRGLQRLHARANLDLRAEHPFRIRGTEVAVSLELFNVLGDEAITSLQTMVNNGPDYWAHLREFMPGNRVAANEYFKAPHERVPPRSLRLGLAFYF